jgi:hypothetical protein
MGVVQERKRARERRERSEKREKRDHAHKGRRNTGTGAKKRCRKRSRNTVDGASIWPTQRVGHNTVSGLYWLSTVCIYINLINRTITRKIQNGKNNLLAIFAYSGVFIENKKR